MNSGIVGVHDRRLEQLPMSASQLLKSAERDTVGPEVILRIVGTREPPPRMVIQVAITGTAAVQIQGRVARDAPWQDVGSAHSESTLFHIDAVQFLRAVTSGMAGSASVSVWAVWGW
jgi:hypothetical protein